MYAIRSYYDFYVPKTDDGITHTTEIMFLTQSASDQTIRARMLIGEEITIRHYTGPGTLDYSETITFTNSGNVIPGVDNEYLFGDSTHRITSYNVCYTKLLRWR